MPLITISNFAKKHKVSRESIYAAIKDKRLTKEEIGGVFFIDSKTIYKPIASKAYGRKSAKRATKK